MLIGYARVSTGDQNARMQLDALKAAGCESIFEDHGVSGGAIIKPQLIEALKMMRPGDTLVVWRLDRLSRSLSTLIETMQDFAKREIHFKSLKEQIETVTPGGRLYFHMIAAFAEFERDVIEDRAKTGIRAARDAGVKMGPPMVLTPERWNQALELLNGSPPMPVAKVASLMGVTRQAIYKRLKADATDAARIAHAGS